jgi:hypothetical protein
MRLSQREGRKQQTAELRAPAKVPPAVWHRAFAFPAIAVTAIAGMTNAKTGLRLERRRELNNHVIPMV